MVTVSADTPASEGTEIEQRRGRPRCATTDVAILTATIDLAGEVGITGLSMDVLAERAGVSKATIYRRWPSKEQLVLDALRSAMGPLDDVDTGSLRADLSAYLGELADRMAAGRLSDVLPHLVAVACHDPGLRDSLDEYVQYRRRPLRAILDRAAERGDFRDGVDIDVLADTLIGPFAYRKLFTGAAIDRDVVERVLDLVLPGAVPHSEA